MIYFNWGSFYFIILHKPAVLPAENVIAFCTRPYAAHRFQIWPWKHPESIRLAMTPLLFPNTRFWLSMGKVGAINEGVVGRAHGESGAMLKAMADLH
jgi:hypothetical protein